MTYDVCQTCLLLPVDLTRSECAAWVQAIGSIFAIFAAICVAIYQANKQQLQTRQAIHEQTKVANLAAAEALSELAIAAVRLQKHFEKNLSTRTAVHEAAETGLVFDMAMLEGLEKTLGSIEFHKLPAQLVRLGVILSSSITQLRMKVSVAIKMHGKMDSAAFDDFFKTLNEMTKSLDQTSADIEAEIVKIKQTSIKL